MTSRSARSLLAAGTLLLGLGLGLGLASCGDGEPTATAPASTPTSAAPTSATTSESPAGTDPSSSAPAPSGPELDVTIQGDSVTPTNKGLEVKAGETLTLVITSDRAGELHVHSSPEQELEFKAGTTEVPVTLSQPGQVDIEEHESDSLIARVLVK